MWLTLARSNRCSPGPARLAPGVRAAAGWLDMAASPQVLLFPSHRILARWAADCHATPIPNRVSKPARMLIISALAGDRSERCGDRCPLACGHRGPASPYLTGL